MPAATDRMEFSPPPQPGLVRAFALAILAHLLLMIALTWGIRWNRESENAVAEAELWSSIPQQAAPKLVEQPPPPPAPEQKVVTPPPPPAPSQADIAIEREKKKQELAEKQRQELEKQKKLDARKKLEEQKRELLAQKKEAEERQKREEQAKEAKLKTKQRDEDKKLAALRAEQMKRIQGLAGATGAEESRGTALRSAGPSDSYAGRIRARVKPNIVFTDEVAGNPTAEVDVGMAPDGTITSRKIRKSSGVKSWDDAVLRALDKTEVLPRDVDGRVHTPLTLVFKLRD
ncbi:MAG: TonB family protein [Ramlibacter sp.]